MRRIYLAAFVFAIFIIIFFASRTSEQQWQKHDILVKSKHERRPERYLIARCDEETLNSCGGWDNRVNGALLTYVMANLTGRTFKFENLKPNNYELTKYLVPNKVNWSLPHSLYQRIPRSNDVLAINKIDDNTFLDAIPNMNFTTFIPNDIPYVYFLGNRNYEIRLKCSTVYKRHLSWMRGLKRGEIKAKIFNTLFEPSIYLKEKIDRIMKTHLTNPKNRLICAHVRIGKNPSNKHDGQLNSLDSIDGVWNYIKNHSKTDNDKVFVMSDADEVINEAKRQSFGRRLITTEGPIVHVDRDKDIPLQRKCAGLEKLLTDQQILMKCDVLMVSVISGVSRLAAYVRATDKDLYCWRGGGVEPCRRQDFDIPNGIPNLSENCGRLKK